MTARPARVGAEPPRTNRPARRATRGALTALAAAAALPAGAVAAPSWLPTTTAELGQPAGMTVRFEDRVSDVTHAWDFGDGMTGADRPDLAKSFTSLGTGVDTTDPETAIAGVTDGNIAGDPVATFSATDDDTTGATTFECQVDSAAAFACTSPATLTNLADGSHTLSVTAIDPSGNRDDTPATDTFIVDKTAPTARFDTAPTDPTNNAVPRATASSPDDDVVNFLFALSEGEGEGVIDHQGSLSGTYQRFDGPLPDGTYTISVTAFDAAGNQTSAAAADSRTFTIDTTPPTVTVTNGPADGARVSGDFSIELEADEEVTYECKLDDEPAQNCNSTQGTPRQGSASYAGVSEGPHTFAVTATDKVGHMVQVVRTFTVDSTPPTVAITAPADGSELSDATPTISGTASMDLGDRGEIDVAITPDADRETDAVFRGQATITDGAWAITVPQLALGTYVVSVRHRDTASNQTVLGNRFRIVAAPDTAAPTVTITAPTAGQVLTSAEATIAGTATAGAGDDDAVEVAVAVDDPDAQKTEFDGTAAVVDGRWTITTGALPNGRYVAHAVQRDQAGNDGTTSVAFQIAVPADEKPADPKPADPKPADQKAVEQPPAGQQPVQPPQAPVTGQPKPPVADPQVIVRRALTESAQGIGRGFARTSIQTLLAKPSTVVPFQAPGPGTIKVDLLAPVASGAQAGTTGRSRVVATGAKTANAAGEIDVRVKLTATGRKALKRLKRLKLTVRTSFTAKGAARTETATTKVTVKRRAARR